MLIFASTSVTMSGTIPHMHTVSTHKRVLVAMSGGTDSSAVCLMLREAGYIPVGMTMRVFDLPSHFSHGGDTPDFIVRAQRLACQLGMDHHVLDVRKSFKNGIIHYFLEEYMAGRTPNPCVLCNRDFKFRLLAETADRLDCSFVATGHYVQTCEKEGKTYLLTGIDETKDQSYFLWRVPQSTLRRCLFPLGGMHKSEVRAYLEARGFRENARQRDSMEVCFIDNDYRDFLRANVSDSSRIREGRFVSEDGKTLGTHKGIPFYTTGQRKGIGIALGKPTYVLRLNAEKNTIVLGPVESLFTQRFLAADPVIVDTDSFFRSRELSVRIRYHSRPVSCRVIILEDGRLLVETAEVVSAVTPGQSAVFYIGPRLVGGAVICSQKGIGAFS